jgi:pyridinium-3,5-biscarboxylic acid mononucleotide synthase
VLKPETLKALLEEVASGTKTINDALVQLSDLPFEDLGYASIDHHRELRTGFPEIVYGSGKTAEQIAGIVRAIVRRGQAALVTRIDETLSQRVISYLEEPVVSMASFESLARILYFGAPPKCRGRGTIAVVCAGTSDIPVMEEAARTAELLGNEVLRICDVGVAGLHRLLPYRERLESSEAVIVVAGMEGALPSVVGGLISRPIIAVPTSIGSGTSFGGITALLAMLNSCSSGITVVNIDNGFGAGYAASLINRKRDQT